MWIHTKNGFYSVVKKKNEEHLTLRARCKEDMDAFIEAMGEFEPGICEANVKVNVGTDYMYRIQITKKEFNLFMGLTIRELDYDNFKNASCGEDSIRHDAYYRCWKAMYDMQNRKQHAGIFKKKNRYPKGVKQKVS
jgi:hypothetical protein